MLSHLKPYLSNDLSLLNSISFVHLPMNQSPFLLGASRLHCLIYKVHPVRCDGFFILPLPSALVKYLFPFPVSPTGTVPDSPHPRGCPPLFRRARLIYHPPPLLVNTFFTKNLKNRRDVIGAFPLFENIRSTRSYPTIY